MLLPASLFCLLQAWFALADTPPTQLSLNSLHAFSAATLNPTMYTLPVSTNPLSISVALCSYATSNPPRFFVANDSTTTPGPNTLGQPNVYEIELNTTALGAWTGDMLNFGVLAIYNATQSPFEVGVSDNGPIHQFLDTLPLLGDTTTNQVLLFSPPFSPPSISQPTYPNYTLPSANLTFPSEPSSPPDWALFIAPTSSPAFASLPRTGCAMRAAAGNVGFYKTSSNSEGLWLRDSDGWRWQWFINGLTPQTNYTVYGVTNGTQVSGPIYFVTKSAAFACTIVYSVPFCPSVAYAAPLPNSDPAAGITGSMLPDNMTENLLSGMANFTVMLTTLACGRDLYSPLVTCADCQAAYRTWLCLVSFPRCTEYPTSSTTSASSNSTSTASLAQVTPALQVHDAANPRNPYLPAFSENYTALLPCIEMCNAVDRACPPFLGFACPKPQYTASWSYGVGYIDSGEKGEVGGGSTGTAADRWGNVYCNAGGFL